MEHKVKAEAHLPPDNLTHPHFQAQAVGKEARNWTGRLSRSLLFWEPLSHALQPPEQWPCSQPPLDLGSRHSPCPFRVTLNPGAVLEEGFPMAASPATGRTPHPSPPEPPSHYPGCSPLQRRAPGGRGAGLSSPCRGSTQALNKPCQGTVLILQGPHTDPVCSLGLP